MRIDATTIDELLGALDERRRADVEAVDALITAVAPDEPRYLFAGESITMVGYGRTLSAEGAVRWPVVALAPQKRHISVYVSGEHDGVPLAEYHAGRLGRTSNGKGCIRFTRLDGVDTDALGDVVRASFAWAAAQHDGG